MYADKCITYNTIWYVVSIIAIVSYAMMKSLGKGAIYVLKEKRDGNVISSSDIREVTSSFVMSGGVEGGSFGLIVNNNFINENAIFVRAIINNKKIELWDMDKSHKPTPDPVKVKRAKVYASCENDLMYCLRAL
jgi:hypothetical protein